MKFNKVTVNPVQVYAVSAQSRYGVDSIDKTYVAANEKVVVTIGNDVTGTDWTGCTQANISVDNGFTATKAVPAKDGSSIKVTLQAPAGIKGDVELTLDYQP